jgi:hypothetical protein
MKGMLNARVNDLGLTVQETKTPEEVPPGTSFPISYEDVLTARDILTQISDF